MAFRPRILVREVLLLFCPGEKIGSRFSALGSNGALYTGCVNKAEIEEKAGMSLNSWVLPPSLGNSRLSYIAEGTK